MFRSFAFAVAVIFILACLLLGAAAARHASEAYETVQTERYWAHVQEARDSQLHRETMFQLWTVALASFSDSNQGTIIALSALLGFGAAVAVIRWLERKEFV